MSFPIPPTDNLYKFAAIAGIVAVLSTQFLWWSLVREYWDKNFDLQPKVAALSLEIAKTFEASARIAQELEATKDPAVRERLRAMMRKEVEVTDALRVRATENTATVARLAKLVEWIWFAMILAMVGSAAGFTLAFWGFYRWYWRVQVYQDRAIRENNQPRAGS